MVVTLSVREIALAFQRAQARRTRLTVNEVQRLWGQLDPRDLSGSWAASVGPRIVRAMTAGQLASAGAADDYVDAVVDAEGADPDRVGRVRPEAFAGAAADGRPLDSLMLLSFITTKQGIAGGLSVDDALMRGLNQALRLSSSEVTQAGRNAVGSSMAGKRTIQGYVRVVQPPACSRCIILAGKEYGWNRGFQRHPRLPLRLRASTDHAHRPQPGPSRVHRPELVLQRLVPCRAGPRFHGRRCAGDPGGRRHRASRERPPRHVHHDRLRPDAAGDS